ncbi:hypothetical protein F5884DRAFT_215993 [Xylogone sp. PMI_703]|nr:hypothetical protein F5884DRAFT_215993 [Xylogone sp. PMI_703]
MRAMYGDDEGWRERGRGWEREHEEGIWGLVVGLAGASTNLPRCRRGAREKRWGKRSRIAAHCPSLISPPSSHPVTAQPALIARVLWLAQRLCTLLLRSSGSSTASLALLLDFVLCVCVQRTRQRDMLWSVHKACVTRCFGADWSYVHQRWQAVNPIPRSHGASERAIWQIALSVVTVVVIPRAPDRSRTGATPACPVTFQLLPSSSPS